MAYLIKGFYRGCFSNPTSECDGTEGPVKVLNLSTGQYEVL